MPLLVNVSKIGKLVFFDNFCYTRNKNSDFNLFGMFRKFGESMVANGSLTENAKYPGQHNHEEFEEIKRKKCVKH